ncbi:secretion protein [Flavobacterium geliluteum]|uniref:Secretion protein n=1 Tax=Flavobacterium geliluteum TaxID=2816120 RepID=A0A940X8X4_9FLAO|nr:secretion protein [Flavobacterium geliluteum]MBP4138436.1 secretion protein [Flavobacterium geliluteum]
MKQIFKLGLVVALFLTTTFTYALGEKGDYILYIKTGNGKVISFTLNNVEKSSFAIYDENNNLLYTGVSAVNELEISKTLSLEGYPTGTYILEVKENTKVVKHEILVSNKKSKTVQLEQSVNESPAFRR